jgi:hypothetical protein
VDPVELADNRPLGRVLCEALSYIVAAATRIGQEMAAGQIPDFNVREEVSYLLSRANCAARVLCFLMKGNATVKEVLLSLKLELPPPTADVNYVSPRLLMKVMEALHASEYVELVVVSDANGAPVQTFAHCSTTATLLRLLCEWLHECPEAQEAVFASPESRDRALILDLIQKSNQFVPSPYTVHVEGLATLSVALCLDYAETIAAAAPAPAESGKRNSKRNTARPLPHTVLFDLITKEVRICFLSVHSVS